MVIISGFQPEDRGSIPLQRSKFKFTTPPLAQTAEKTQSNHRQQSKDHTDERVVSTALESINVVFQQTIHH